METFLAELIHALLWVLAVVTTVFPITYMIMAPWSKSWLGRGVVILGWSLASLADLSLLFHHWNPPALVGLLITAAVFLGIIIGSVTKTVAVVVLQVRSARNSDDLDRLSRELRGGDRS